jgi:hypothetical protein
LEHIKNPLQLAHQNLPTLLAFGVETAITYGAMPIFIRSLAPAVYTTIVFVIGGGVGFISTHLTRRILRSQRVCFLNSLKEEKVRGAIHLTLLSAIALTAMMLRV